jgi:hypothetical protein
MGSASIHGELRAEANTEQKTHMGDNEVTERGGYHGCEVCNRARRGKMISNTKKFCREGQGSHIAKRNRATVGWIVFETTAPTCTCGEAVRRMIVDIPVSSADAGYPPR